MNNKRKKEYFKPEIIGVKTVVQKKLLLSSCVGEGCAVGEWKNQYNWVTMKKKYSIPKIKAVRLKANVVLLGGSETTIPPGPVGMVPGDFTTTSSKDVMQRQFVFPQD